jgi:hypothetical protein
MFKWVVSSPKWKNKIHCRLVNICGQLRPGNESAKIFTLRAAPIKLFRVERVPFLSAFSAAREEKRHIRPPPPLVKRGHQLLFSLLELRKTMPAFDKRGEGKRACFYFSFSLEAGKAERG